MRTLKENDAIEISIDEKYMQDIEFLDILRIFGKENLEEIQNVISEVTGLAFVTVDYKGEPLTELTQFSDYCQKIRENPEHAKLCKLSDASGAIHAAVNKKTSIYFCPFGLLEVAIPIVINGKYMGGFIGGQIRCSDAPPTVLRMNRDIVDRDRISESDTLKELAKKIRKYSYQEFVSITRLVELVISQITKKELISSHHQSENLKKIKDLERENDLQVVEILHLKDEIAMQKKNYEKYFFQNTLNVIANLSVLENAKQTNEFVQLYLNYLRQSINENHLTLRKELKITEIYLRMYKIRYMERIDYNIEMGYSLIKRPIPFHMILPFVQALLFFGMTSLKTPLYLNISILEDKNDICIELQYNGIIMQNAGLHDQFDIFEGEHEGTILLLSIAELKKRLVAIFGRAYKVKINESPDGQSSIVMRYPKIISEEKIHVEDINS